VPEPGPEASRGNMRVQTVIESVALFFQRKGEMHFQAAFLSPRLIREALESRFRLAPLEETSTHLRFKIIRFLRIYGGPIIWPQAEVDITIRRHKDSYTLYWYFFWPEYYLLLLWPIFFGLVALTETKLGGLPLFALPLAILFSGFVFLLDTMWVARRVRKAFTNLGEKAS
jgi:hypothetical protein